MKRKIKLLAVLGVLASAVVLADGPKSITIAPGDLPSALEALVSQTGVQLLYDLKTVQGLKTHGAKDAKSPQDALTQLLENTALTVRTDTSGAILISRSAAPTTLDGGAAGEASSTSEFRVAQTDQALPAEPPSAQSGSSRQNEKNQPVNLEEVVVTAQKKSERLLDVPVPLTVVDTETLANGGAGRLQDYFATVPGLSLLGTAGGGGTQYITLRGLSTTFGGGPTAAMVIDDVPFGSSTGTTLGQFGYPDIDPSDLARIEVLKGPQGTLYGADSLGGLIKVVTQDPSTTSMRGHVQVFGEDVSNGTAGYGVRGSVNVPISDTLAVRASAFTRRDPGYIDNVTTGQDNVNDANAYGARIGALWLTSAGVSLKLGAMFQNTQGFGVAQVNTNSLLQPTLGGLSQTGLPGTGRYNNQMQLYTATLNAKLAGLNLVAVSGYGINKWSNSYDDSLYGGLDSQYFPQFPQATSATSGQVSQLDKFSQEFRLSGSTGLHFDWLAGAFYTQERNPLQQAVYANDGVTGAPVGALVSYHNALTFREYAVFGDLTIHVTDRFDVQVGGRESWNHQVYNRGQTSVIPGLTGILPPETADGSPFTYLVTPEFKFSPDLMIYSRIASGYRIGGPNGAPALISVPIPLSYKPDTTVNFDLGIKASLLDRTLILDAAAYYINWKDIQIGVMPTAPGTCNCYYQTNGARARSEGLELSLEAHPAQGTLLKAGGSFNNAVLTQDLPAAAINAGAYGLDGDRLPYSIRTSGSLGIDQDIVHFAHATGFLGADLTYISARYGEFASGRPSPPPLIPRLRYPAYTTVNFRAGVRDQRWLFNLFVNNLTDKRGIIGGRPSYDVKNGGSYLAGGLSGGYDVTVIQPRTVGLSVSRDF